MKNSKLFGFMFLLLTVMVTPAFAIDSTALFDTQVLGTSIEKGASDGTPIGTVVTWPAMANPSDPGNWLECNGQTISQASYPELFAIIGSKVPDYTGMFLRGMGGNSAALGTKQTDGVNLGGNAIASLGGKLVGVARIGSQSNPNTNGVTETTTTQAGERVFATGSVGATRNGRESTRGERSVSYTGSTVNIPINITTNSPETRPANVAVRYLIRAKN